MGKIILFLRFLGQMSIFAQLFDPRTISFFVFFLRTLRNPFFLVHLTLIFLNGCCRLFDGKSWMFLHDYC